jgi:hypothetical protein
MTETTRPRTPKKPTTPKVRPPHPLRVEFDALPPDEQRSVLTRIQQLLESQHWIFAKTMPENPHEYCLRKKWMHDEDFVWTVERIRGLGYRQKWKKNWYTVLDVGEHFYFTLGWPIGTLEWGWKRLNGGGTILINRKKLEPKP